MSRVEELKRRTSLDSTDSDVESVISESFNETMKSVSHSKHHIAGYLLKKSKNDVWQRRYFETNSTFLTYYKTRKMSKLLAALNLATVGDISLVGHISDKIGDGYVFQLELKDRNYVLRTSSMNEAEKWIHKLRSLREEALSSSIPEETSPQSSPANNSSQSSSMIKVDGFTRKPGEVSKADDKQNAPNGEWSKKARCCMIC